MGGLGGSGGGGQGGEGTLPDAGAFLAAAMCRGALAR